MKKILFVDRDGTLIIEPSETLQINSLRELKFLPNVITSLKKFAEAGFEICMITNQDGLGTESNPRENYEKINAKMFEILESEDIKFLKTFECPHLSNENCNCRKPKTGLVTEFLKNNKIDLKNSIMIGDRQTDLDFAKNLNIQSFLLTPDSNWKKITKLNLYPPRKAKIERKTKETEISIKLNLDGKGNSKIKTQLNFFNHMLEQISKHGNFDLEIFCKGDLNIDEHHTIEDTAIVLGEAFKKALNDKKGIERYAWERILIMDESKTEISLDFSGRAFCNFEADFKREFVGDLPTEMIEHFFQSFCLSASLNLHIKITGKNTHHQIESCFKAFARCLREAVKRNGFEIISTKGIL